MLFSIIEVPIFELSRKGKKFIWMYDCQLLMDTLNKAITKALILINLDFLSLALQNVDASILIRWGTVMSQLQSNRSICLMRFESGI